MEKSQYDELRRQQNIHWWFLGKKEIVIDYAKHHAGFTANENNKIIDVGCGMGLMLEELSHYGKIFGMDFEPEAVEFCKNSLGGVTFLMFGSGQSLMTCRFKKIFLIMFLR